MSVDMNRAKALLDVVHAVATAGPAYSNILALANAELLDMDGVAAKDMAEIKAKEAAKAAAKAKAEEEARAKAQADAETKLKAADAPAVTYTSDNPERKI